MKKCFLIAVILVVITYCIPNFGMNKPHLLFHLGQRTPLSLNIGWGYWTQDEKIRYLYENTNNNLYVNMKEHNGETIFEQDITDSSAHIQTKIQYQLFPNKHWQTQINMTNQSQEEEKLKTTWFMYATIQNNDYRAVDHEKLSTYMTIVLNKPQKDNQRSMTVKSVFGKEEKLSFIGQQISDSKIFGLSANISETYNMKDIVSEFKHLVEISEGQNVTRTTDEKLAEWENNQVNMMGNEENFIDKPFVIFFIYGKYETQSNLFLTNSTNIKSFDYPKYKETQQKINDQFKISQNPQQHQEFIKHVISNLFGGITYYSGRLFTQNSLMLHRQDFCYSFTPSRLIFPRSFLWDDGFHQAVAINYKPEIVLDMLISWVNKIDNFGWIGREQIRGQQIARMMPDSRFVFQDWFEMNPPTLMLTFIRFLTIAQNDHKLKKQFNKFLVQRFHKVEAWYKYFKSTQSHETLQYDEIRNMSNVFYRWQCKDQCNKGNFMGSGLDDYPRRMNQKQISKEHADVVSWLYFFSDSLLQLSYYIRDNKLDANLHQRRINFYKRETKKYRQKLFRDLLDRSDYLFKDTVVQDKDLYIESFVNKIGYINIFPFFTGMLTPSPQVPETDRIKTLKATLQIMSNKDLLYSEDGLRSLSISDQLYGTDDNYWRGAIWIPINYMVLRACKLYYWNQPQIQQQIQQFYGKLRQNLIETIKRNYQSNGYLYENYYEGKGHRGFPFYGWTSLIVNIITEKY